MAEDGYPIVVDRPSFTDATSIMPKGRFQLEGGYTFLKINKSETQTIGELLLRIPLQDNLELRLFNVGYASANVAGGGGTGLVDPSVGLRYRIKSGVPGKSQDIALVAQTTIAAGSSDWRVKRSQPTVKVAGYYQIDPMNGIGWNVVYSDLGTKGSRFAQWALSGCWSRVVNTKTGAFLEVYRVMPTGKRGPEATFSDAGLTYLINKATQVDFRFGTGFNQKRDGWFLGAGIAIRL